MFPPQKKTAQNKAFEAPIVLRDLSRITFPHPYFPAANILILGHFSVLIGPTRKPRHASVFSTHSDMQVVPAFHCIRMLKSIFSTH